MSQQKPRQRGGRVLDKATPEQVNGPWRATCR